MTSREKSRAKTAARPASSSSDDGGAFGRVSGTAIAIGAAAAALAGAAIYNVRRAREAEQDNPMRGDLITIEGADLHYVDSGTPGPAIVLLHGNGTTLEDWFATGIFQQLSKTSRVIAFDRPGFGYSSRPRMKLWSPAAQAEAIALAMTSLGASDITLVCHSFATQVGLKLALDHPGLLRSLVLMSGYYYPSARADVLVASIPAIPVIGDIDRYTVAPLLGSAMRPMLERKLFAPAPVAASWEKFPFAMTLRPSQLRAEAAEAALMIPSAARLADRYGELSVPVFIVSGEGDQVVDHKEQSQRLASELPSATLTSLGGVGHMIHHTAAERVLQVIGKAVTAPAVAH